MYAFVRHDGRGDDQRSVGLGRILSWSGEAGGRTALCELELSTRNKLRIGKKSGKNCLEQFLRGKHK